MNTILFPTDYSPASAAALRYATALARHEQATLVVLYVEPPSVPPVGTIEVSHDSAAEEAQLADQLSQAASDGQLSYRVTHLRGDPAAEIIRIAAEEHADLIVMATAGRSGWRRVLMGSVAESVMRDAPCPVLTLREPVASGG